MMSRVNDAHPLPDAQTNASLLTAVSAELTDIASESTVDAERDRLAKAADLLGWLASELTVKRQVLAHVEENVASILAAAPRVDDKVRDALSQFAARRTGPVMFDDTQSGDDPSGTASNGVRRRALPDVTTVSNYLNRRCPGDRAHSVQAITGGYSKVTLLVSVTLGGHDQEIVLRQIPAGRQARSLPPEFDVLRHVHGHGLPAPRPLWIEPADNELGGAFFAMEKSSGSSIGDVWGTAGATRELCLDIADLYAALHRIPVDGLIAPVSPRGSRAELHAMIDWQRDVLAKRGITVEPVLAALLAWLERNIPAEGPRRSLIHGDAAFSNLLVENGSVSAVLDWEAAHIGNPADELAYLKPSIEPVVPWSEFMGRYVAAGGYEPPADAMRFFDVWSNVWRHIGCLWLRQNFESTGRYESAVAAFLHGPRFLDQAVAAAFD